MNAEFREMWLVSFLMLVTHGCRALEVIVLNIRPAGGLPTPRYPGTCRACNLQR